MVEQGQPTPGPGSGTQVSPTPSLEALQGSTSKPRPSSLGQRAAHEAACRPAGSLDVTTQPFQASARGCSSRTRLERLCLCGLMPMAKQGKGAGTSLLGPHPQQRTGEQEVKPEAASFTSLQALPEQVPACTGPVLPPPRSTGWPAGHKDFGSNGRQRPQFLEPEPSHE